MFEKLNSSPVEKIQRDPGHKENSEGDNEASPFEDIEKKREQDIRNVQEYKNGQQLKLEIFAPAKKEVIKVVINRKTDAGKYDAFG